MKLSQTDKDNIKELNSIFGEQYSRDFIQKVYLMNNKQKEKTIEMFCEPHLLPEQDEKPQLTIVETAATKVNHESGLSMISTSGGVGNQQFGSQANNHKPVDKRSYILEEYK